MKKTVIIALDFINDIVHSDGKIAKSAARIKKNKVIQNANHVIAWGRKNNMPIVHVKVGFSKNYVECPKNSPTFSAAEQNGVLKLGEWGTEFHKDMDVQDHDSIVTKHRISAFYATDLETILRAQQADTVIVFGVATHMAVSATARDAHDRDYNVIVVSDACETYTQELQDSALQCFAQLVQIKNAAELDKAYSRLKC